MNSRCSHESYAIDLSRPAGRRIVLSRCRAESVRATYVTVTTSLVDHKSIALPDDMRLALKNYQARCDASASLASTSLRYGSSSQPA